MNLEQKLLKTAFENLENDKVLVLEKLIHLHKLVESLFNTIRRENGAEVFWEYKDKSKSWLTQHAISTVQNELINSIVELIDSPLEVLKDIINIDKKLSQIPTKKEIRLFLDLDDQFGFDNVNQALGLKTPKVESEYLTDYEHGILLAKSLGLDCGTINYANEVLGLKHDVHYMVSEHVTHTQVEKMAYPIITKMMVKRIQEMLEYM